MDFRRLFSTTLRFKQNIDFLVHHLFAEFGEIVFTGGAAALNVRAFLHKLLWPLWAVARLLTIMHNTCLPRAGRQTVTDVVR